MPAKSAFAERGFAPSLKILRDEIRRLYCEDGIPWVVGYSGGKDSSATLQLVWLAIRELPPAERTKPIHVISTDTLVEQPLVAAWVEASLAKMRTAAERAGAADRAAQAHAGGRGHVLGQPDRQGLPAPGNKFRWCTERLKIKPSNKFIRDVVRSYGEAILVLGTRKAESQRRAITMSKHDAKRVRERLGPNASLPNSLVYTPIEDWNNDDVWLFLMQVKNPWGHDNKSLLGMYQGATEGGECPLVVDTSTPSCGTSRFGCWVCTVVDKDRSMEAMIKNDEEKVWMTPLLELRNELDIADDRHLRDFRRMNGHVQLFHDRTIPGPYTKQCPRTLAPPGARGPGTGPQRGTAGVPRAEAHHAWTSSTRSAVSGSTRSTSSTTACRGFTRRSPASSFPSHDIGNSPLRAEDWTLLKEVCGDDEAFFDLQVRLLGIEQSHRGMSRRAGIFEKLESRFRAGIYTSMQEAVDDLTERDRRTLEAKERAKGDVELPSRPPVLEQQLGLLRDDLERVGEWRRTVKAWAWAVGDALPALPPWADERSGGTGVALGSGSTRSCYARGRNDVRGFPDTPHRKPT